MEMMQKTPNSLIITNNSMKIAYFIYTFFVVFTKKDKQPIFCIRDAAFFLLPLSI